MYLLTISFKNGDAMFVGPFPSYFRANEYADEAVKSLHGYVRHIVTPLITPHNVVQQVIWR